MTKIIGRPVIWFVACLIPVVGILPAAILCIDTAKCFGGFTGYGIGMLLLGFVFWPLLGFSDATYTHVAPAAIAAPQLSLSVKSPWVLNLPSCRAASPVLLSVTLSDVPVADEACAEETKGRLPKARLVGEILTPACWPIPLSAI